MSIKNKKYILSLIAVAVLIIIYLVFQDKIDAFLNEGQNNGPDQTVIVDNQTQPGNSGGSGSDQGSAGDTQQSTQNSGTLSGQDSSDDGDITDGPEDPGVVEYITYKFRSKKLLDQHYDKHGKEIGFKSAADYEKAASDVVNNPAALTKTEKEDGDYVYYVEDTNEFVIVSTDGYLRTYFLPSAGKSYYDRQ
ncbi:MAG: hypothetical protein II694_07460 [Lachnospiraceae bacterium]|nr:hypothetical protein [Lachnospiraceae bacterium]